MSGSARSGAGGRRTGNLPAELSTFVGRAQEIDELARLVQSTQLVTVTGVGGVGKTHTALEVAQRIRDRFPDGVWLVELSQLQDSGLLAHAVAKVLQVRDQTTRPLIDVLADHLAERECLLILDTCEHLIDTCALLTMTLLPAAPGLRVLATSRQSLNAQGERVLQLSPLPVPAEEAADVRDNEAVRLFADRARMADPEFVITAENAPVVARLCRRLEGLPLALELAAPWLRVLSVERVAERLEDRFRLLTKPAGSPEPDRHDALRTTIGWSHELCTPAERLLWARASVFAGSFDRRAALEICTGGPLAGEVFDRVLAGLVRKSILLAEGDRYRMLDTIRDYGAQWRQELGEDRATRRRHRDYYLTLAHRAYGEWMSAEQITWFKRFRAEHADLRVALEFCLTSPEDAGGALEMAGDLWFFWYACGFQREGRRYLERALAQEPAPGPQRTRAAWVLGMIALTQGDLVTNEQCVQLCNEDSDPAAAVAAGFLEASALTLQGEHTRAIKLLSAMGAVPVAGGMVEAIWMLERGVRAFAHVLLGELAIAVALAEEARSESAMRGERALQSFADYVQAMAHLGLGQAEPAADRACSALENKRPLHDTWFMAMVMDVLAMAVAAMGESDRAARLLGIGQHIWDAYGLPQLGSPELVEARRTCERQLRATIGDAAYQYAFDRGMDTEMDAGITYALSPC
jgi:predicted ATPase